jgi:branched-chain amino acid transport system substrate-binding protein
VPVRCRVSPRTTEGRGASFRPFGFMKALFRHALTPGFPLLLAFGSMMPGQASATEPIALGIVSTRNSIHQPDGADVATAIAERSRTLLEPGGTLLGAQVRFVEVDDDCTRAGGENAARRLAAENVAAVIGHVCAVAAVAAAPIYTAAGILTIVPAVRHPRLTSPRSGPLLFRLAGRADRLAAETADFLARRFEGQRLAIVHDRSAQGTAEADAVDKLARARGMVALRESLTTGEKSYTALVDRLQAAAATVIFYASQPIELTIILARMREIRSLATVVGSEHLAVPDIETAAAASSGRLVLMLPWPSREQPAAANESAVHQLTAAAFAAWVHAVRSAGSANAKAVAEGLHTAAAPTAQGPIRFDANGDAEVPAYVPHVWRAGRWRPLDP